MKKTKSPKPVTELNASSMADIAFLLLIFFLVTTTIVPDKGIAVKLPPWQDVPVDINVSSKNILSVRINGAGQLMVEGKLLEMQQLKDAVKEFVMNPTRRGDLPDSPLEAVVSLQNDKSTSYSNYIEVYDQLQGAYAELWKNRALEVYGTSYEQLPTAHKRKIRDQIPQVISEAEPTDYALERY